jgi:GABA(A) receptor-associated protein
MVLNYLKKTTNFEFKKEKTLTERKNYSNYLLEKYPDRVPVIIKKSENDKILQDNITGYSRYLMPKNLKISEVLFIIRNKINLKKEEAVFIFVNGNILVPMNETIGSMYDLHKSEDGFLYIIYSSENTFG